MGPATRAFLQAQADRALAMMQGSTNQYHTLWLIETGPGGDDGVDTVTGLPLPNEDTVTQILPAPRVMLGAKLMGSPGGAQTLMGDAHVTHIQTSLWPMARLIDAVGFRIDGEAGERYQILAGTLRETGHDTMTCILARVGQPREDQSNGL